MFWKGIGQAQYFALRHLLGSVVKHNVLGQRNPLQDTAVDVQMIPVNICLIISGEIEQAPERHIGVWCTLVFIETQHFTKQKRNIIFIAHIKRIFQRCDRQGIHILIVRVIHCIIKFQ